MNRTKSPEKSIKHFSVISMKGFSHMIPGGVLLTTYPSVGIIFLLETSIRFFDGSNLEEIYQTEDKISVIALRGKFLLVGEQMFKGQLTTTTIINLETRAVKLFKYQKTCMQFLSLSANHQYLCSVGSSDNNKQELVVVDVTEELEVGCKMIENETCKKKDGVIVGVEFSKRNENLLAILFTNKLVIARIEDEVLIKTVAKASKVREFSMMQFDPHDISCFACSKNGDISEINLESMKEVRVGPRKRVIIAGIKHIRLIEGGRLVITGVKGFIALIDLKDLKILKEVTIKDEIISLTEFKGSLGFVATAKAAIYVLNSEDLSITPFYICNNSKVSRIHFSDGYSKVFATCSGSEIMIWKNYTLDPILRVQLPGKICHSLYLSHDGKSIISGWSDDCIRFFNPMNGKEVNKIKNAHCGRVTALVSNKQCDKLISGGDNGGIRVWRISKEGFGIIDNIFTGHKGEVHYLDIVEDELYSCSEDGSFAIWSLSRGEKTLMVRTNNYVKKVLYYDEYSVLTIGSGPEVQLVKKNDGEIIKSIHIGGSYLNDFEVFECSGEYYFLLGGELHDLFALKFVGKFDSPHTAEVYPTYGSITSIALAPDQETVIVSTAEGYIFCFGFDQYGKTSNFRKESTI